MSEVESPSLALSSRGVQTSYTRVPKSPPRCQKQSRRLEMIVEIDPMGLIVTTSRQQRLA